jgi:hypothetical protein
VGSISTRGIAALYLSFIVVATIAVTVISAVRPG